MSQTNVFPAAPEARRNITRLAYRLFTIGTGLLAIGVIAIAVSLAATAAPSTATIAAYGGIACTGGIGLIVALTVLLRVRQPIQVEVTPDRLIWREGPRIATLEYDEVERIELVRDRKRHRDGSMIQFPVVRFIENDGEMMEFEISFDDHGKVHYGRFDAHAITQAVLPYLRNQAMVSPMVDEFVSTGMVDIDGLSER